MFNKSTFDECTINNKIKIIIETIWATNNQKCIIALAHYDTLTTADTTLAQKSPQFWDKVVSTMNIWFPSQSIENKRNKTITNLIINDKLTTNIDNWTLDLENVVALPTVSICYTALLLLQYGYYIFFVYIAIYISLTWICKILIYL